MCDERERYAFQREARPEDAEHRRKVLFSIPGYADRRIRELELTCDELRAEIERYKGLKSVVLRLLENACPATWRELRRIAWSFRSIR
jgi:hypothetical protein